MDSVPFKLVVFFFTADIVFPQKLGSCRTCRDGSKNVAVTNLPKTMFTPTYTAHSILASRKNIICFKIHSQNILDNISLSPISDLLAATKFQ